MKNTQSRKLAVCLLYGNITKNDDDYGFTYTFKEEYLKLASFTSITNLSQNPFIVLNAVFDEIELFTH
jgi:hypothetical protein